MIADVDFHGTPDELRFIANFLLQAAGELNLAQANDPEANVGIELDNANSAAGVSLWVNVVRNVKK